MKDVTDLDLARAYNDVEKYPTLDDVARVFGKSQKTIRNRIGMMRRSQPNIQLISRNLIDGRNEENPISEKPQNFMEHWTSEDCIQCLRDAVLAEPDRIISRNYFNQISGISESTWNRYFGTFEQFKKSADVKLSRGAREMELNISRHASRDLVLPFNEEKASYAGRYVRDNGKRFKTALIGSDFHDIDCDPFVRRLFIETAKRVQPECIFLNGDMLDLPEFGKYGVDPRNWDVVTRIKWMHTFLEDCRNAAPDAHIVYLEGNHEFRLLRHLAEATPALKVVLSDLHGFTVSTLLGLDKYEIEYHGKADLRAWSNKDTDAEIKKNYYVLWNQLMGDHFPQGASRGVPGWNGHHHQLIVKPHYTHEYGASCWVQLGGGHVANAEYCEPTWNNSILLVHADTKTRHSIFEPVEVRDFAVVGGEFYYRTPEEAWYKGQTTFSAKNASRPQSLL